jgi:hypothetical protein
MYTAYYDRAETHDDSLAVVVAGFVATNEQWAEFERKWNDTLKQFGISLFQMRDFNHSLREFSKFKQRQEDRHWFLRQLLSHIILRVAYSVGHAFLMADYWKVNSVYALDYRFPPYALAGRTCVARINLWAEKLGIPKEQIQHVFEDGAAGKGLLYDNVLPDHEMKLSFKKRDECVALQAAELLASEKLAANRGIFDNGIVDFKKLNFPIRQLRDLVRDPLEWGTYTHKNLEEFCINAQVPRREALTVDSAG